MLFELMRNVGENMVSGDISIGADIAGEVVENAGSIFDNKWVKGSLYVAGAVTVGYLGYMAYSYIKKGIDADKAKKDLYEKYDKDMSRYKQDMENVDKDLKAAQAEVSRLIKEKAEIGDSIKKEYETKMTGMDNHIKALEKEKEELKKEITKLDTDYKNAVSELENYKSTNETLTSKNKELEQKLADVTNTLHSKGNEDAIKKGK